jgi:uncharacterized peroxidase-related enzyme
MARLRYVEKDNATSEQEKILAELTQKSGKVANMWKLWSHSPQTLETFMMFYKSVMKGVLDARLRELAYMKTSLINDCAYCLKAHQGSARRVGITEQQIQELADYATSSAFSPLEKLVLQYAEELTRTAKGHQEIVGELKKQLSEADIVELTITVGVANLTNRFNMSLATDAD